MPGYTSADLAAARAARLAIATGRKAEQVTYSDGQAIRYGSGDLAALERLISQISAELAQASAEPPRRMVRIIPSKGL